MNACNKTAFNSFREAQGAINLAHRRESRNQSNHKEKRPIRSYFCDECEKWHVTSWPKYVIKEYKEL